MLIHSKKNRYESVACAREMFSRLKVNLKYIDLDKRLKCLMITSAVPNEGKSYVSANLAASLASDGLRVLLIDGDLRNSSQQEIFVLENRAGLSSCIADGRSWDACLNQIGRRNLFVLPAGRTPPNPAAILSSGQMRNLLETMRKKFDFIIIDTAPVLMVPDPVALSRYVDGILLVTRWGKTGKWAIDAAVHQLEMVNAPLVGTVLNNVQPGRRFIY